MHFPTMRRLFSRRSLAPPLCGGGNPLRRTCSSDVRVRFAPSPTGQLHLGGLRTALFNHLFAKSHGGRLVLRVEDTDRTRLVPGAEEKMEEMLNWVGIAFDESPSVGGEFGPYRQSERLTLYADAVKRLLDCGAAYRCFCTERRLDLLRREAARQRSPSRYDGRCRDLSEQEVQDKIGDGRDSSSFTVRFKLRPDTAHFHDLVYGDCSHDVFALEGDPIIMKSDGFPTYHLANVVDDHEMRVTHVLRGVEWQVSTPKHLMMYDAFGWKPPEFAHLPLIMNSDGTKLSKRQGDLHIEHLKKAGIYPEAVLNFVSLIGGGFEDKEHRLDVLHSLSQLQKSFSVTRVSTHSGKMDLEVLNKLNRVALKERLSDDKVLNSMVSDLRRIVEDEGWDSSELDDDYFRNVLLWSQNRVHVLTDLVHKDMKFLWTLPRELEVPQFGNATVLRDMVDLLKSLPDDVRSNDAVQRIRLYCNGKNIKFSQMMKFLRVVFAGAGEGPPVGEMIEIYGKQNAVFRLENGIKIIKAAA